MIQAIDPLLSISTPLGEGKFSVEEFTGEEGLSTPFEFRVSLLSSDDDIDPRSIIGEGVAVSVRDSEGSLRRFHGRVVAFSTGDYHERGFRRYEASVRPWLWMLSKRKTCRIFQDRSVVEIVTSVFEDAGFVDFETSLHAQDYERLEYCVQYNESDLDFVHRLLEEHGIYYYFRHEATRHVLLLADSIAGYRESVPGLVAFESGSSRPNSITSWARGVRFVSGRWCQADFNYLAPSVKLMSTSPSIVKMPVVRSFEQFVYPGKHRSAAIGNHKARVQMEAEEATHETVTGCGNCAEMQPGGIFEIAKGEGDLDPSQEGRFLVTKIYHIAREASFDAQDECGTHYTNEFECVPSSITFKPPQITPSPRVHGPQTAIVVGPEGESIFTDKYGRVKVRFHWDRSDSLDENSSCWIRVAQPWAGKNFGGLVLPRVGHEVVVEFLDGDPDRPLINGSVFNAANLPPQNLPADKAKMTIRSSSIDAAGSNEITMTDSGGSEGFYVHAQYDFEEVVENNRTSSVGNDESHTVGNNQTTSIVNDQASSVGNNQTVAIATNRSTEIGASDTTQVAATSIEKVGADKVIQAGANVVIDAGATLTLRCGAASITLTAAGIINISGSMVNVTGSVNANVSAPITNLTGSALLNASGAVALVNGGVTRVTGQNLIHIGGSKVESVASGENLVQGAAVKLN